MKHKFQFTFTHLQSHYQAALDFGYSILTCSEYYHQKGKLSEKVMVNRVDIDQNPKKVKRILKLYDELGVKATFFIRLHAPEYNPFSFENYRIFRSIKSKGHEIGLHSEVVDQSAIWDEDAKECLIRDIEVLNTMLNIKIDGVASHGGMTGLNNLDFWKDKKPSDFGLLYEAYDTQPEFNLMNDSFYISDSNWTHWKCYNKGQIEEGDHRHPGEHIKEGHPVIYLLIHPETFYHSHFYE